MSRRGWALFIAMSVIWGIPYLMIKVAVGGVSVPVLVFTRVTIGALVLLPLALRGGRLRAVRQHWRPVVFFALCELVGPWALLSDAERKLPSSLSGLLVAIVPILGVLAVRFAGDADRLGWKRWTGLGVGLVGVAILAGPHLTGGSAWPTVEVILTAVGYALGPLVIARHLDGVPSLAVNACALTLAALVYATPAALTWPHDVPSGSVLLSLAGLGFVCTALAFGLFFALIREVGPGRATVITYINPAVAVAAGVLVLGEPLTLLIVAAFALILVGSVLATSKDAGTAPIPEPVREVG